MSGKANAMARITMAERRRRLARRHRLVDAEQTDSIPKITESVIALHSSDPATVFLSAAARMKRPSIRRIENALYSKRSVVRHHAMRRTIWVMTTRQARQAHGATTAKIAAAERKRTLKAFEQGGTIKNAADWYESAAGEIRELLLQRGPLSARAIGSELPHLAIPVQFGSERHSSKLNAHTKVLQGEGFCGTLVRGPSTGTWNSAEYVWSETDAWLGQPLVGLDEESAAAAILRDWLHSFGPATTDDIKWWFGWTATLTKKSLQAVEAECVSLECGTDAWVSPGDSEECEDAGPWVQLLPGLDASTMGWKQRDWYLDSKHTPLLFDQFGNAGPTIWADGRVVGAWIQKPDASITVRLFVKLGREHQRLLKNAIDRTMALVGDTVVKPRFPARIQKELLAKS